MRDGRTAASDRPAWVERGLLVALVLLTVVLYGWRATRSGGAYGDSFHHLLNGVFLYDVLRDPVRSLSDPLEFARQYYLHYPAVNLGYYFPVFAASEALVMSVFGVSVASGQLTVLLLAVMMTAFTFAWFRLRWDAWWAAGATGVLTSAPLLVRWGRDIMLEIPALAFMMGSVWAFQSLLERPRPSWRLGLGWAALTALAMWTKQHAIILLGVFSLTIVLSWRWEHLRRAPFAVAAALIVVAAAGLVSITLWLGGDAVGHSVGFTVEHAVQRINTLQWTFYLRALPEAVGWPVLVLAAWGVACVVRTRETSGLIALSWVASFYLMHSYFRAQEARYACLWVPPFVALAVIGLQHLRFPPPAAALAHRAMGRNLVGALLLVGVLLSSLIQAVRVQTPRVSSAYASAAADLCNSLAPFACMTFVPGNPGRMAANFRLAVEEHRTADKEIFDFGQVLRAGQVLRRWQSVWPDVPSLAQSLRDWNVKYILTETPRVLDRAAGDTETAAAVDALLALGEFRVVRTYPVRRELVGASVDVLITQHRVLTLYERIAPMTFNSDASPVIRTGRLPTLISPDDD